MKKYWFCGQISQKWVISYLKSTELSCNIYFFSWFSAHELIRDHCRMYPKAKRKSQINKQTKVWKWRQNNFERLSISFLTFAMKNFRFCPWNSCNAKKHDKEESPLLLDIGPTITSAELRGTGLGIFSLWHQNL